MARLSQAFDDLLVSWLTIFAKEVGNASPIVKPPVAGPKSRVKVAAHVKYQSL